MPRYAFATADLATEHQRTPAHTVVLEVQVTEGANPADPDTYRSGAIQVTGSLAVDCPAGESRFRPGMMPTLRLTAPDGRATRLPVLLVGPTQITVPRPGQRTYHWDFLMPAQPQADAAGLLPRAPGAGPPSAPDESGRPRYQHIPPAPVSTDPKARELTLAELLTHLDHLGEAMDTPAVRFTGEGGFTPAEKERGM